MSALKTTNLVALQALLPEVLFTHDFDFEPEQSAPAKPIEAVVASAVSEEKPAAQPVALNQAAAEFVYQGDKSTGVLFILRYPDYPYFSPQAEEAFVKTIGALGLQQDKVAVVNLANPHNPNDFKRMMTFFQPRKITLLGVEPRSLKLPDIAHNAYMKGRVATVFNTFSFEEMFADVQKKKLFWTEFKTFIKS